MALEIKPTPVLKGASAARFLRLQQEDAKKTIPKEQRDRILAFTKAILEKAKL